MPAYATVDDMVKRFGAAEMIRLSVPQGQDMTAVNEPVVTDRLAEASSTIDTYLRKRYRTPLDVVPPEISRAACMLARYDLSMGEDREPSEQTRLARKEVMDWLQGITRGDVLLELEEVPSGDASYSMMSERGTAHDGRA